MRNSPLGSWAAKGLVLLLSMIFGVALISPLASANGNVSNRQYRYYNYRSGYRYYQPMQYRFYRQYRYYRDDRPINYSGCGCFQGCGCGERRCHRHHHHHEEHHHHHHHH